MFPLPWNFPFRKKDGTIVNVVDAMGGGGGGGSDLPDYDSSDAGKVLGVDDNGDLEWSDKVEDLSVDVSSLDSRTDTLELHSARVDNDILVIGGSTIENWQGSGVNIINNIMKDITLQGIAFTVNDDKTVRAVGTAESGFGAQVGTASLKAGLTYKITDTINGVAGEATNFVAAISNGSILFASCDNETYPATYTALTDMEVLVQIIFLPGTSVNKIYFPSIIDTSVDPGGYVAPAKSNLELTAENQTLTKYADAQSNPNLLDNPWFTVNQRGITSWSNESAGYSADRWKHDGSATGSITNGVYTCNVPTYQNWEDDRIAPLLGKTVTLSWLLSDGTIGFETRTLPSALTSEFVWPFTNNYVVLALKSGNLSQAARIKADVAVKAVKLELGSVSTLAMDTAPNYATELLKCQRYFYSLKIKTTNAQIGLARAANNTTAQYYLYFAVAMRSSPILTVVNANHVYVYDTSLHVISAITKYSDLESGNSVIGVALSMTTTGLTQGGLLLFAGGADLSSYPLSLDFSADL